MDQESYKVLADLRLPHVHLIALEDFEIGDKELLNAKENRTRIEYYFTCTPSLPLFIFRRFPEVNMITYLDADLFFFADPAVIYDEIADHSIAIIGHRFPPNLLEREQYGIYNVGWLSFKRDKNACSCLQWWRERCLDWCYDRLEEGRFADQKYLDDWPTRFPNVAVLHNKGANVAPWNLGVYNIHQHGDEVLIDEQPLIFFHYHGFRQITSWLYDPNLAVFKVKPTRAAVRGIYVPYIGALQKAVAQVLPLLKTIPSRNGMRNKDVSPPTSRAVAKSRPPARWMFRVSRFILTQSYIFKLKGFVR
jgi:hypothetical protein